MHQASTTKLYPVQVSSDINGAKNKFEILEERLKDIEGRRAKRRVQRNDYQVTHTHHNSL